MNVKKIFSKIKKSIIKRLVVLMVDIMVILKDDELFLISINFYTIFPS